MAPAQVIITGSFEQLMIEYSYKRFGSFDPIKSVTAFPSFQSSHFSVINTTQSLHIIDIYAQDCIRYLVSGTHTKSRYNVRYDDLKSLGYQSLVHAYYSYEKELQEK